MSRIELTALIGSHPLGALASFGLLRVVAQRDARASISFVERDDWICVLDADFGTERDLLAFLAEWGRTRTPAVFSAFGEEDVRVPLPTFRARLRDALSDEEGLELTSFLVALAADGAEDKTKHLVKPSPFYMASGQQSFLDTMKRIHGCLRRGDAWDEALFGPWRYSTSEWGAGWDPGTERMHALRFKAPTKDKTACVVGAVALGFQALPLFPTFSVAGAVRTVGWFEDDRLDRFRWPLPKVPLKIDALGVLLASDVLARTRDGRPRTPIREGIAAVYESTRHTFGQGYAVFRPARRVA